MQKNVIIIGLGNEYISDDGVGIKALKELQHLLKNDENVPSWLNIDYTEQAIGGIGLLDIITNYDICIIIDAIYTRENRIGTLYRFIQKTDRELVNIKSSHQISLSEVLYLARLLKIKIPELVVVYGIEVEDVTTFSEQCTPIVQKNIKNLAALIYNDLVNYNIETITQQTLSVYFEEELIK